MDDLFAPNFEGHYQKLLATLMDQASARPSIGGIWLAIVTGDWKKERDETERQRSYFEDLSTLPVALLYFDLPGVHPLVARAFVLARLLADGAPVRHLREEVISASADITKSGEANNVPVLLFTDRMEVITTDDAPPTPEPSYLGKWLNDAITLGNA